MNNSLVANTQTEANKTALSDSTCEQLSKNNEAKEPNPKGEEAENAIQSPFPVFTK